MSDQRISRRSFMVRTIIGIFASMGAALAIPFGGFTILPALRKREAVWNDAGSAGSLVVDIPQERRFFVTVKSGWQEEKQERSIWIAKRDDGSITAFAPNCPHLGCGYRWFQEDRLFKCPCHGSVFDINGRVISGPSPRPLDTLETKIEEGKVLVKFEIFQLGISKKIAA